LRDLAEAAEAYSRAAIVDAPRNIAFALEEYACRLVVGRGMAGRLAGVGLCCWSPGCNKPPAPCTTICGRCRIARYCSAACQAAAWPCHRVACARMQARRRQKR
jgi:hypothetical protein